MKKSFGGVKRFLLQSLSVLSLLGSLVLSALSWAPEANAAPRVFKVTSGKCVGPGSLGEAFASANTNPGIDTIDIASNLSIYLNVQECIPDQNLLLQRWAFKATESVIVQGNGALIYGSNNYINRAGDVNPIEPTDRDCPKRPGTNYLLVGVSPGFVQVGDGSGGGAVEVSVKNLNFQQISSIADISRGSRLVLENSVARSIFDLASTNCADPIIRSDIGGDLTLKNVEISRSKNFGYLEPFNSLIRGYGSDGADRAVLTMSNVLLDRNYMDAAITWAGDSSIENLRASWSGGLFLSEGSVKISNSLFSKKRVYQEFDFLRFLNATAEISATTVSIGVTPSCDYTNLFSTDECVVFPVPSGAPIQSMGAGSTLALKGSAVQVFYNQSASHPTKIIEGVNGGVVTADQYTFIQPVAAQDATALRTETSQPNLITDQPALLNSSSIVDYTFVGWPKLVTPLLGTVASPGLLVDAIPNAACGAANQLLSPVDGRCLAEDVFGNPRTDGNGKRSIGAVQNTLSPHVQIATEETTSISLAWAKIPDPSSGPVTGYAVFCGLSGTSKLTRCLNVAGHDTTTATIPNLTPNTAYDFTVVAVNGAGDGPPSNLVTGTTLAEPHLDYPNGAGQVGKAIRDIKPHVLHISKPRTFGVSQGTLPAGLSLNASSGYISGTPTEAGRFTLSIVAVGVHGRTATAPLEIVISTAPPKPTLDYADGKGVVGQLLLPLSPHVAGLQNPLSFSVVAGSLPSGVTMSSSSGVITGTPKESGSFRFTVRVRGAARETQVVVRLEVRQKAAPIDSTSAMAEQVCGISNLEVPDITQCIRSAPEVSKRGSRYTVSLNRKLPRVARDYLVYATPIKQIGQSDSRKPTKQVLRGARAGRHGTFRQLGMGCWAFHFKVRVSGNKIAECSRLQFESVP